MYNILVNGFLFIAIFARKNGVSENMIFDWMLFLELTFKTTVITNVFKQSHLWYLFKESIFLKSAILNRSYGSLKQNLHSVLHQHSAVALLVSEKMNSLTK